MTLAKRNCGSCEFLEKRRFPRIVHSDIGMRKLFCAHLLIDLGSCWYTFLTVLKLRITLEFMNPHFPKQRHCLCYTAPKYLKCRAERRGWKTFQRAVTVLIPWSHTIWQQDSTNALVFLTVEKKCYCCIHIQSYK